MYHTIDDLLYEVNRVAKVPTVEELRESVTRNVVSVYKKVDAPSLWQGAVQHYSLSNGSDVKLPVYTMIPLDLVIGKFSFKDFSSLGRYDGSVYVNRLETAAIGGPINYNRSGDTLYLESQPMGYMSSRYAVTGDVTLSYWRIPLDEEGAPLIDDRIWDACKYYCQAEEARVALHGKNTQSFAGVPYQVDKQEANREIDAARAMCNKMSPSDWRSFWIGIRTNQPG